MKKTYLLLMCLLFAGGLWAQNLQISGVVVDGSDNQTIPGVVVTVKGTTTTALTDIDGRYTILAHRDATLVFTSINMKSQEVQVGSRSVINVAMEMDALFMDEVMVVAYGTATKRSFVGSASVIKSEDIARLQSSSPLQSLSGTTAGVQVTSNSGQPGSDPTIYVRGVGSITAGKSPLMVVDGAFYDGPMSSLNPADIANMTVLKDAAATSLYGSRASNGVIMISTKRGAKKGVGVNLDMKVGVNTRAISDYDVVTDPATYYEQTWLAMFNAQRDASTTQTDQQIIDAIAGNSSSGLAVALGQYNNYNVPWNQLIVPVRDADGVYHAQLNPNAKLLYNDDWSKEIFSPSMRQEYNLSMSGRGDKDAYYFSLGYLNDKSYAMGSDYIRYTGRLSYEREMTSWLSFKANMAYTRSSQDYPEIAGGTSTSNYFRWARAIAPIFPVYLRDINTGEIIMDPVTGKARYDFGNENGYTRPYSMGANPLSSVDLDINKHDRKTFTGGTSLEAHIIDGLSISAAIDLTDHDLSSRRTMNPYYGSASASTIQGRVYRTETNTFSYTASSFLKYVNTLFDKLNIDALAGMEVYDREYSYMYGHKTMMVNSDVAELRNAVVMNDIDSYKYTYSVVSLISRVNLSWDNKYYLMAGYRKDGTSRFHPDNRWGDFWALGGAWVISDEPFMPKWGFLNMLKLKASIGSQGNDNLGGYLPYLNLYSIVNSDGSVGLRSQATLANPNLTWEKNTAYNAGVEFSLFNRLSVGFEYFNKRTDNLLFNLPLAPSAGYTQTPSNIGSLKNSGIELEISADVLRSKDIRWSVGLNLSHIRNEIISMPEDIIVSGGMWSGNYRRTIGGSVYDFYLMQSAGLDEKGKMKYYTYDSWDSNEPSGTTTALSANSNSTNRKKSGSALPDVSGGFNTSFQWKGFDVSLLLSYSIGGYVLDSEYLNLMNAFNNSYGNGMHKDILKAWTPTNTNTNVPRLSGSYVDLGTSDYFLVKADYLSLNNVSLGYSFPSSITKKWGMDKLRIYVVADNVALISARKGLDPRQNIDGSLGGDDNTGAVYSPIRTVSLGINVGF